MNNNAIPGDCKKAKVVHIYKGGDRSVVGNCRLVRLTSVLCKQMEHIIAGYLRQVREMSGWFYVGQHGFRPGHSCESQVVTVCQDITDSLDKGVRTDAIIKDISKAFDLVPPLAAYENRGIQNGFEGSCMVKGNSLQTFVELE